MRRTQPRDNLLSFCTSARRRESKQRGRKAWNLRKKKSRSVCAESKQSSLKQTPEKQFAFISPQSAANMNGTASTPEGTKGIPMRRVVVKDPSHMPSHYSETPGGTLFSTTPGGTRIIYERKFLLDMRHSPLSKTPTKQLPVIPGVTLDNDGKLIEEDEEALENEKNTLKEKCVPIEEQSGNDLKKNQDEFQFDMDI